MTNTTYLASVPTSGAGEAVKRAGSLSTMKLAELQGLAGSLGLTGTAKMRKGDLVIAIRNHQSGAPAQAGSSPVAPTSPGSAPAAPAAEVAPVVQAAPAAVERPVRSSRRAQRSVGISQADEIATPVARCWRAASLEVA